MNKLVLTLALAATASLTSNAVPIGGPVLNPANGHYYYLLSPTDWLSSQSQAVALGGNLVTINNLAENNWVYSTFGGLSKPLWLGLTDRFSEGTFGWVSGEAFSFSFWNSGEPNNGGGFVPDEDYAYMVESNSGLPLTPGRWNDVPVAGDGIINPVYGVVEVVPEPTAMTLVMAAGLTALFRRRQNGIA
jgi:hypothetical protein